jgi:hypothetical protein
MVESSPRSIDILCSLFVISRSGIGVPINGELGVGSVGLVVAERCGHSDFDILLLDSFKMMRPA